MRELQARPRTPLKFRSRCIGGSSRQDSHAHAWGDENRGIAPTQRLLPTAPTVRSPKSLVCFKRWAARDIARSPQQTLRPVRSLRRLQRRLQDPVEPPGQRMRRRDAGAVRPAGRVRNLPPAPLVPAGATLLQRALGRQAEGTSMRGTLLFASPHSPWPLGQLLWVGFAGHQPGVGRRARRILQPTQRTTPVADKAVGTPGQSGEATVT